MSSGQARKVEHSFKFLYSRQMAFSPTLYSPRELSVMSEASVKIRAETIQAEKKEVYGLSR